MGNFRLRSLSHSPSPVPIALLLIAWILPSCRTNGALDAAQVRELVPHATAVPLAEFDALAENGVQATCGSFESRTLSVVLSFATGEPKADFRALETTKPPGMNGDDWVRVSSERVTLFPPECLREIEIQNEGDHARGRFHFHRDEIFEGFADFEAERRAGTWTLTRLRLPLRGLETRLEADGTWRSNLPGERDIEEGARVRALPHDQRISVRVVDLEGQPVPEAELVLHANGLDSRFETTNSEGRATFTDLPAIEIAISMPLAKWGRVRIQPHLLAPAGQRAVPSGQELVLKFRQGVPLRGRVVDAEGLGVEAKVQIKSGGTHVDAVVTDADGIWIGSGLAGAEHTIHAFPSDRRQGAREGKLEQFIPDGNEVVIRVERVR